MSQRYRTPLTQLLVLAGIALASVSELFNLSSWRIPAFILWTVLCFATRSGKIFQFALILLLEQLTGLIPALRGLPVLGFLLPFLVSTVLIWPIREARAQLMWFRRGYIDGMAWTLIVLTGILSTVALILWGYWTNNLGIGAEMVKSFEQIPKWIVFCAIIPIFALLNAFAEEVVYRGVIQEALAGTFDRSLVIILLQASAFAAVHYGAGFPNGAVGYLMVLVYGSMLGYLRIRTRGILAPYIAHVIADTTIAVFLVLK